ncbi:MAG: hypothetical protein EXQ86_09335 [Rhodospirillales bacterium]|nr:hypothetical protein [Rhodospirillales bacterium]
MFRSRLRAGACLVLLSALGACATAPDQAFPSKDDHCAGFFSAEEILKLHTIEVDDRGQTDAFDTRFKGILQGLADYKKCRGPTNPTRLLIFAHGGLNSFNAARKQAVEQAPLMRKDGYYPVFMIWRTGPLATYWDQIAHVRTGDVSEVPSPTFPLYLAGDLGQGFARAPVNLKNQFKRYWRSEVVQDEAFEIDEKKVGENHGNPDSIYYNVTLPKIFQDKRVIDAESVFKETLYFLLMPVRGVVTILLDPIGKTAWENMVRRALSSIHRAAEFLVCEDDKDDASRCAAQKKVEQRDYPHGSGGFSKFFQELEDCFAKRATNEAKGSGRDCLLGTYGVNALEGVKVTLIGHSMGTIIFNELISLYPGIPYENIVYMAAASSIRHFMDAIVPLIRDQAKKEDGVKFYSLMLHPLAEARERSVHQGAAPSGTLLEWIDEMYEPSVTPLDRTLGKWRNIRVAKHLLEEDAKPRIKFKIFGFDKNDPVEHGQFNDMKYCYWRPAFWGDESSSDHVCDKRR